MPRERDLKEEFSKALTALEDICVEISNAGWDYLKVKIYHQDAYIHTEVSITKTKNFYRDDEEL